MALLNASAGTRRRPVAARWGAAAAWLFFLLTLRAAPAPPAAEYQVKAVFLFNFAQFAEWPAAALPAPDSPLVIGILGDDPFGAYLDDLVKDEKVAEHPLRIQRYREVEAAAGCHILFVSRSEGARLDRILPRLAGHSVLTISDADTFNRQGGMVRFVTEDGKIRLRINVEAARAAGLTISSKILRPATIVAPGRD